MKGGARVALAIVAGYYLGRRHKLRLAAALAVAGAVRGLSSSKGGLLQQGVKALGSSPELEKITERIRGDLLDVGKAAAVAATSKQIDSLSGKLHERAEELRRPGTAGDAGVPAAEDKAGAPAAEDKHENESYEDEQPEKRSESGRGGPEEQVARTRG
jgi:hypothetical protein